MRYGFERKVTDGHFFSAHVAAHLFNHSLNAFMKPCCFRDENGEGVGHTGPCTPPQREYKYRDHTHCFNQKESPCGIKGKHACCLCRLNPQRECCKKCLGSYGFGKDNWGCIEKGCECHSKPQEESKEDEKIEKAFYEANMAIAQDKSGVITRENSQAALHALTIFRDKLYGR